MSRRKNPANGVIGDDGNGNYVISKRTGVSLGLVLALAAILGGYFTGQWSLAAEARVERQDLRVELQQQINQRVEKDQYRQDVEHFRQDLKRVEEKLDQALGVLLRPPPR